MKVKGLDGQAYRWDLRNHVPLGSEEMGSSYHKRAREVLAELFGCDTRLEEVPLPGTSYRDLRADFYLPSRKLIIEVHGRQHYTFVALYHRTALGFLQHQERDRLKAEWCELNGLVYVELPFNESDEQWRGRITAALAGPARRDA